MSNEKDVPQTNVDFPAFKQAGDEQYKKIQRKQRRRDTVKGILIVVILAVVASMIYFLTQLLLTSRPPATHVPEQLLVGMAVLGAVLITSGLATVIALMITIIYVLKKDVGFHSLFVSAGISSVAVTTVAIAFVVVLYLFWFYNA